MEETSQLSLPANSPSYKETLHQFGKITYDAPATGYYVLKNAFKEFTVVPSEFLNLEGRIVLKNVKLSIIATFEKLRAYLGETKITAVGKHSVVLAKI